jgi:hypothetical protein
MNSLSFISVALVAPAAVAFAGPTDRAIIAAMALSEQPNYTWFSTIDDPASSYEIEGRTTNAGVTWVRMPMLKSIQRRLGRENDTQVEALFDDRRRGLLQVGNDWKSISELPSRQAPSGHRTRTMVRGSANAGGFGIPGGASLGAAAPFLIEDRQTGPAFSTLHFGVMHPHEELAIIVSSFTAMESAGDVVTGSLSDMGAALLLVRPELQDVEPRHAAGEFKLWIKNGVVIKYQLKLKGVVALPGWDNVPVQVNMATTLKDIGTTTVNVPDSAQAKLRQLRERTR